MCLPEETESLVRTGSVVCCLWSVVCGLLSVEDIGLFAIGEDVIGMEVD